MFKNYSSCFILLLSCLFFNNHVQGGSLFDIEFGSHPADVLERYPEGRKVFNSVKVRLGEHRQVVAKSTKFNRVYHIYYFAHDVSCNVMIDKLLAKFPPNSDLKNHKDVLAQQYLDWKSGDRYTVSFSSCGDHRTILHVRDSVEEKIEDMQLREEEVRQREESIANAQEINI
jgi:hypothetical protein